LSFRIGRPMTRFFGSSEMAAPCKTVVGTEVPVIVPRSDELLERDAELEVLADVMRRAAGGVAGTILIEGPAGVGKTRLLQAVAEQADAEPVRVLQARGGELERSFPFGIAAQLFGSAVAALDAGQRASVLSGAAGLAAELVDPRAPARAVAIDSQEALHPRLHGLYWLCVGLAAHQPMVLVVDDAHWADEPSLQWLLFMARRLGDVPVTLVASARPSKAGDWPEPLLLLRDERHIVLLRPQPLSASGCRVLMSRLLGEDPAEVFAVACYGATGGNPFFLSELMAAVREDRIAPTAAAAARVSSLAPEGIVRSCIARLARLPPQAAGLARCIAVLGAEAELRQAAALAHLEPAEGAVAADALAAGGFLRAGRPLRLVHPVVRTALYAELPEGERAELHRRAARMLADEAGDLDAVAVHLLASEPGAERSAAELLLSAAERAVARGVPATAASYLRRALSEPPPADLRATVLQRLGVVESLLGDPGAAEHIRQAMELYTVPTRRAELAFDLSVGCLVAGRADEAISTLEDAIQHLEEGDVDLCWRLEAQLIGFARMHPAFAEVLEQHLNRVPHDLPGDTLGERSILAELAFDALVAPEPVNRVVDLAKRALGGDELVAEQPRGSWSLLNAIWALVLGEEHELAMRAYDRLLEWARREGSPISFALVLSRRSQLHRLRGAIQDAIADARLAIDAGSHFGHSRLAPHLYATLIDALLEAGEAHEAAQALAATGGEEIPDIPSLISLRQARGRLRIAQENAQGGIDDLLAAHEQLARLHVANNPAGAHFRSTAAVALARLGRRDEARQLALDELAAARRFGAGSTVGTSLRAIGVIEGGSVGIDYLYEAVAQLGRSPARLEHARALGDLGAAVRRTGKRQEAQKLLRQALDLADRCGGKPVAEQARAELLVTGARPRRTRISGVDALTASERRVAQLAAEGLTNRQIAQALFISMHTVSTHLGHVYSKLNLNDRAQLVAALGADAA
jgi:DNA-binding CsgD family transcriptional regulator